MAKHTEKENKKATQIFASASNKKNSTFGEFDGILISIRPPDDDVYLPFLVVFTVCVCVRVFVYIFLNYLNSVSHKIPNQIQAKCNMCVLIYFMLGLVDPFHDQAQVPRILILIIKKIYIFRLVIKYNSFCGSKL